MAFVEATKLAGEIEAGDLIADVFGIYEVSSIEVVKNQIIICMIDITDGTKVTMRVDVDAEIGVFVDQAPESVHPLTPISDDEVTAGYRQMVAERDARIAELEASVDVLRNRLEEKISEYSEPPKLADWDRGYLTAYTGVLEFVKHMK